MKKLFICNRRDFDERANYHPHSACGHFDLDKRDCYRDDYACPECGAELVKDYDYVVEDFAISQWIE